MDIKTSMAINEISKRLNEVEYKLEQYLLGKHEENKAHIGTTDDGLVDIAAILDSHDSAIMELANMISGAPIE